jgi:hypothetical protein
MSNFSLLFLTKVYTVCLIQGKMVLTYRLILFMSAHVFIAPVCCRIKGLIIAVLNIS